MQEKRRPGRGRLLIGLLSLVLIAGAIYGFIVLRSSTTETQRINYTLIIPQHGTLNATVSASGAMQPREVVKLAFSSTGTVAETFVKVGSNVQANAPLARLDTRDLELRVKQAQAQLAQVQASYEKLLAGARTEDVAAAQAQLAQARSQFQQVQGSVTAQDIAAAQTQLEQAQASLARLEAGPKTVDVQAAQAQLDQARASLQTQRDSLSSAKTRAQSQIDQAANALRDRQADYEQIYWSNRELEKRLARANQELPDSNKAQESSALRAVENGQQSLDQAQLAFDQAVQAEISGTAAAEAQVRNAQASLDRVLAGADKDQILAARAQVSQAQASLDKLRGGQRSGSLGVAQAGLKNAEANLARVTAPPIDADLASVVAQVQNAEAGLAQAQLALDKATLRAPLAGVVAEVNLKVGETPGGGAAVVIADLSAFYVDVTVDEIDVARLAVAQPVTLTLDALPDLGLGGNIERIDPLSTQQASVTSYKVRIQTATTDARVRPGMSANAEIVVAEKRDVLMIPRRAVRADRGRFVVDTADTAICKADRATWPTKPTLTPVPVTTGMSNDLYIEVTSGNIVEGTCVYVQGIDARLNLLTGPPPGVRSSS